MDVHELLDSGVGIPLLSIDLVAADMKISIGKKPSHLADECVEEFVSLLLRGVHCRIKDSPPAFDLIRAGCAGEFRVTNKPGGAASGHVDFGDNSNAPVVRVPNQLADFGLRVVKPVRTHQVKFREYFALDPKTLIV